MTVKNAINWFEIPVTDFERAKKFYETILDGRVEESEMGAFKMGFLPDGQSEEAVGGAIVLGEGYVPSAQGSLLYLNGNDDLNRILQRVEKAGGTVLLPKTAITPEVGFMAFFIDSEGNRIGLHSKN